MNDEALERAFDRKRNNFLEDYDLMAKPALICQACPSTEFEVEISCDSLREAMRGGGGHQSDDGWWNGFKMSGMPSLVFDGLASTRDHGDIGWVSEIHVDGHLSAGVWTFPESANGATNPKAGVAGFYVDAFRDFAYLASKVFEAAGASGAVHLTATLQHADRLALLVDPGRIVVPAPKRKVLRWPIMTVDATELPEAGLSMAERFMRAYGRKSPKV